MALPGRGAKQSRMPMKTTANRSARATKGRGATLNPEGRFEREAREPEDDGWTGDPDEDSRRTPTIVSPESAKTVLSRNDSPDLGFSRSLNPYRGCEHGCIYCYARPSHAYLGLSPGLDFETRLFAKDNAAACLRAELGRPGYRCEPIHIGSNTDGYQPVERTRRITRSVLEVLHETSHPVAIVTKSALVERDLDLLEPMAREGLVAVSISVTTLRADLARRLEPRASAPARRLQAIERLARSGVPVGVNVAPVIPFLTDPEMEPILEEAAARGARWASWTLLRLPWEVKMLFRDWLAVHFPLKAKHVMSRLHDLRGGRDNDPRFGTRMKGEGPIADLLARRFQVATARLGIATRPPVLRADAFRPREGRQPCLF